MRAFVVQVTPASDPQAMPLVAFLLTDHPFTSEEADFGYVCQPERGTTYHIFANEAQARRFAEQAQVGATEPEVGR